MENVKSNYETINKVTKVHLIDLLYLVWNDLGNEGRCVCITIIKGKSYHNCWWQSNAKCGRMTGWSVTFRICLFFIKKFDIHKVRATHILPSQLLCTILMKFVCMIWYQIADLIYVVLHSNIHSHIYLFESKFRTIEWNGLFS